MPTPLWQRSGVKKKTAKKTPQASFVPVETEVAVLKPHPRNYKAHPDEQLAHIESSLREHGFYRNVVAARDNTILAGHGVVLAAKRIGKKTVPVIKLPIDPGSPQALKVLAGDNEIGNLADADDRALTEILKEIRESGDLMGTGFDDQQLAALLLVTRPAHEIADMDEAAEWMGMPGFTVPGKPYKVVVTVSGEEDARKVHEMIGAKMGAGVGDKVTRTWSLHWPPREKDDVSSVKFTDE